jgi:predicted transcriptional regulator
VKLFLTISDEAVCLTLFFKDGHYDDSQILIATDDEALKWALNLSAYY